MTTASTVRMVRSGMPLPEAAAKRRSRRGASGPTDRSASSAAVSLTTVVAAGVDAGAVPPPGSGGPGPGVPAAPRGSSRDSATSSAWQVRGVAPCQHGGHGARYGRRAAPLPLVAPWSLRAQGGPAQRRNRPRLPLLLLRGDPAAGAPPPPA